MKSKILLSILTLFLCTTVAICQNNTIELNFTANYGGQYDTLESFLIENLTQGGDITLAYPDTILTLIITHICDNQSVLENDFSVSQNYPNPFKQQTSVDLYLPEKEDINISVHDILGRELTHYKNTLNQGYHKFTFYPGNEKYYLLTATGRRTSKTIKMLNAGYIMTSAPQCRIVYSAFNDFSEKFKSQKAMKDFAFDLGDTLRFTGFAKTLNQVPGSAVIEDAPETNTFYTFDIKEGIRCPGIPTVTDIEGNIYSTVLIGMQCWMKENLKTTKYNNGTPIPNVPDDAEWSNLTTGAYVWYNNDISWKNIYYALYNGYTVLDANGLCPTGWHVPSDDEWTEMTDFIGGLAAPHGNELKSCRQVDSYLSGNCNTEEHPRWGWWDESIYGTDNYGFTAIPGSYRWYNGSFDVLGNTCGFWTSTEYALTHLWNYGLSYGDSAFIRNWGTKKFGTGVRCVKD